ncbi:MAG: hypothetical protein WAR79_06740 [Melioribacteraceae bacterium]
MIRKIITYYLLSIFLLSTIGVPVTIHYCQMMNSVSFQVCEMCENSTADCCKNEDTNVSIFSQEKVNCCTAKFIVEPLSEKYISAFTEIQKLDEKSFVNILPLEILISQNITNTSFAADNSPPDTYSNSLYLNNSILLI